MSHPSLGYASTGICDIVSPSTEICHSGTDTSCRFYYSHIAENQKHNDIRARNKTHTINTISDDADFPSISELLGQFTDHDIYQTILTEIEIKPGPYQHSQPAVRIVLRFQSQRDEWLPQFVGVLGLCW